MFAWLVGELAILCSVAVGEGWTGSIPGGMRECFKCPDFHRGRGLNASLGGGSFRRAATRNHPGRKPKLEAAALGARRPGRKGSSSTPHGRPGS